MAEAELRIVFAQSAFDDLREIVEYWLEREEPERGEKYMEDLMAEAIRELRSPQTARRGRKLVKSNWPNAQEIRVFKRVYRILYVLREEESLVEVLRFWHSHRDEPFQE
jgi:plasmid stabilization system protein ParE